MSDAAATADGNELQGASWNDDGAAPLAEPPWQEQGGQDLGGLLEVSAERQEGVEVVHARGEIDISTAPLLREHLESVAPGSAKMVVDLSEVTFLDSTGLGVLIAARKRREAETGEGGVELVVKAPQILKVLEVTGLTALFPVHSTLEEALA